MSFIKRFSKHRPVILFCIKDFQPYQSVNLLGNKLIWLALYSYLLDLKKNIIRFKNEISISYHLSMSTMLICNLSNVNRTPFINLARIIYY